MSQYIRTVNIFQYTFFLKLYDTQFLMNKVSETKFIDIFTNWNQLFIVWSLFTCCFFLLCNALTNVFLIHQDNKNAMDISYIHVFCHPYDHEDVYWDHHDICTILYRNDTQTLKVK